VAKPRPDGGIERCKSEKSIAPSAQSVGRSTRIHGDGKTRAAPGARRGSRETHRLPDSTRIQGGHESAPPFLIRPESAWSLVRTVARSVKAASPPSEERNGHKQHKEHRRHKNDLNFVSLASPRPGGRVSRPALTSPPVQGRRRSRGVATRKRNRRENNRSVVFLVLLSSGMLSFRDDFA
jgi:hypothetical protein